MKYESVFRQEHFAGKSYLVTGGNSGIGRCIAHELASLGATVIITGRSEEKLRKVSEEIVESGGKVDWYQMDIRDEAQVENVLGDVGSSHGSVNGLVNCAGGQFPGYLEELSVNGFTAVVRNNLIGTFIVSKAFFQTFLKQNGGEVVTITMDSVGGTPLMGHSAAARSGMDSLCRTEALEWAKYGVRVNNVAVGYVKSSGLDTYDDPRMLNAIGKYADFTPIGRMGTEAEISSIVCFLLSPAAAYVTGQVIQADGGFSLNTATPNLKLEKPTRNQVFHGYRKVSSVAGDDSV